MFLIAGLDGKSELFASKEFKHCPHCNNTTQWRVTKNTNYISLFFIKVLPVKSKYFHHCSICNYGFEVNDSEFLRLKLEKIS